MDISRGQNKFEYNVERVEKFMVWQKGVKKFSLYTRYRNKNFTAPYHHQDIYEHGLGLLITKFKNQGTINITLIFNFVRKNRKSHFSENKREFPLGNHKPLWPRAIPVSCENNCLIK